MVDLRRPESQRRLGPAVRSPRKFRQPDRPRPLLPDRTEARRGRPATRSSPSASPIIFWLNSPASVYTIGLQPHKSRPKRSLIIERLTNSQQTDSSYFPATTPQRAAG